MLSERNLTGQPPRGGFPSWWPWLAEVRVFALGASAQEPEMADRLPSRRRRRIRRNPRLASSGLARWDIGYRVRSRERRLVPVADDVLLTQSNERFPQSRPAQGVQWSCNVREKSQQNPRLVPEARQTPPAVPSRGFRSPGRASGSDPGPVRTGRRAPPHALLHRILDASRRDRIALTVRRRFGLPAHSAVSNAAARSTTTGIPASAATARQAQHP